jgi:hypothetical protein
MTETKELEIPKELTPIQAKWQEAQYLAQSSLLPKDFAGKPANVLIALEYARQLSSETRNLSPISVMQNLYVVHGNCGLSSKFMIALANSSGKLDHPIRYRKTKNEAGKVISVEAYSSIGGEEINYTVDMDMAKAEGWDKNPKYKSMPELMLSYRAASFLIRIYIPEVVMGLQTDDDVRDKETIKVVETNNNLLPASSELVDVDDEDLV